MWLKVAGAALVVGAGAVAGWICAGQVAGRPRQLAELQTGLALLETEVVYGLSTLPTALQRAAGAGPLAAVVYGRAGKEVAAGTAAPAAALQQAVAAARPAAALAALDWQPLLDLAHALGTSDAADQRRHLAICRERLKAAEGSAEAERQRNERLYRYLGFLIGAAVAVVLL